MNIDGTTKVGHLAAEHPLATRVFARHGIDFCCGGGKPLGDVCAGRGLDLDTVIGEIEVEVERADEPETRWDEEPLTDLIDHILETYHASLREELPRLESMAAKVLRAHGDKEPEMLSELARVVGGLKAELEAHMLKEEQVLFPMIRAGQGRMAVDPVSVMEYEHEAAAAALRQLRELTDGYQVPEAACNTWRALWHGLADLERATHQHVHLENNILFPRALAGASA